MVDGSGIEKSLTHILWVYMIINRTADITPRGKVDYYFGD